MNSIFPNSKTSAAINTLPSKSPIISKNGEGNIKNMIGMVRNNSNTSLQLGQGKRGLNRSSFTKSYTGHDFANFQLNSLKKKVLILPNT